MATTTNFGWETPDDTDLVKDGAAAMRTLGNSIDTSFVDLKGGTTGQVLSKASGTDLDFTWVAQDDSNAIQNAIVDAKGDLIAATAADTPARLAVGTNGQVLTADSTAATGLAWATSAAGGMTLINTGGTTLSGTSTAVSSIPSTYNDLEIWIRGINVNTDTVVGMTVNNDSTAASYKSIANWNNGGTAYNIAESLAFASFDATNQSFFTKNNTDNLVVVKIYNYAYAGKKNMEVRVVSTDTGGPLIKQALVISANTGAVSSIEIKNITTGSFQGGTVFVYGVK